MGKKLRVRQPPLRVASVALALLGMALFAHWAYRAAGGDVSFYEFGLVAVAAGLQLVIRYNTPGVRLAAEPIEVPAEENRTQILRDFIDEAIALANDTYSGKLFADYADMLLNPSLFRSRTIETLAVAKEVTDRSLSIHFRFDTPVRTRQGNSTGTTALIPLLVPPKGRIYDKSRIEDDTGCVISPLDTHRTMALNIALLLHLYQRTFALPAALQSWPAEYRWSFVDLVDIVCRTRSHEERPELIEAILSKHQDRANRISFNKLRDIVLMLAHRYVVAVLVDDVDSVTLTFRSQLATRKLTKPIPDAKSVWLTRWFHRLFHVPSGYLTIPMAQARRCESYHLYVEVPERSYVGPTAVKRGAAELKFNTGLGLVSAGPTLQVVTAQRSLLHAYGRGLRSLPGGAEIEGRFYERPYGTELYASIASLAFLTLAIVLRESFLGQRDVDPGAVSLAVPVGLATFGALFSSCVRRSMAVSAAGVAGGLLASLLAVVIVITYLLQEAADDLGASNYIGSVFWQSSVAAAAVLSAASAGIFTLRFWRYIREY